MTCVNGAFRSRPEVATTRTAVVWSLVRMAWGDMDTGMDVSSVHARRIRRAWFSYLEQLVQRVAFLLLLLLLLVLLDFAPVLMLHMAPLLR